MSAPNAPSTASRYALWPSDVSWMRSPTKCEMMGFVSASIAVQVDVSPAPAGFSYRRHSFAARHSRDIGATRGHGTRHAPSNFKLTYYQSFGGKSAWRMAA